MFNLLIIWLLSSLTLLITAKLVKGFHINGFKGAMIASVVIGLFNMVIRPILFLLTLPVTILTLGLFSFVVTAMILRLAASVLDDFEIEGWMPAIFGAVVMSIVNMILFSIL